MSPTVQNESPAAADPLAEQLSAFLDGELPERELDLLLKRLDRDPALGKTLGRYAAIGESLRGGAVARGFADRVCAALDQDRARSALGQETATTGVSKRSPLFAMGWARRTAQLAGGVAVAAAVAGAAIFILQRQALIPGVPQAPLQADATATSTVVIGSVGTVAEAPSYTVTLPATPSPIVPAARLTDYVIAHSEYSSPLGRRSMLSGAIAEDPTPVEGPESATAAAAGASSLPVSVPPTSVSSAGAPLP